MLPRHRVHCATSPRMCELQRCRRPGGAGSRPAAPCAVVPHCTPGMLLHNRGLRTFNLDQMPIFFRQNSGATHLVNVRAVALRSLVRFLAPAASTRSLILDDRDRAMAARCVRVRTVCASCTAYNGPTACDRRLGPQGGSWVRFDVKRQSHGRYKRCPAVCAP